jgi:hypothetical protein
MNFRARKSFPALARFAPYLLSWILVTFALLSGIGLIVRHFVFRAHHRISLGQGLPPEYQHNPGKASWCGWLLFGHFQTYKDRKHIKAGLWLEHRRRTLAEFSKDFFLLAEYWGETASWFVPFLTKTKSMLALI